MRISHVLRQSHVEVVHMWRGQSCVKGTHIWEELMCGGNIHIYTFIFVSEAKIIFIHMYRCKN